MNGLKSISIAGIDFVIQAYLKNDFATLANTGPIASIKIDFITRKLSSFGKEDQRWIEFTAKIDIGEVKDMIDKQFKD
jgi:hypothetical protein